MNNFSKILGARRTSIVNNPESAYSNRSLIINKSSLSTMVGMKTRLELFK